MKSLKQDIFIWTLCSVVMDGIDVENHYEIVFQDIKLITSSNKHRFIVPGGVKQLTKEEFEAFTNQVFIIIIHHQKQINVNKIFFRFKI